jgi:hypothetical protein
MSTTTSPTRFGLAWTVWTIIVAVLLLLVGAAVGLL